MAEGIDVPRGIEMLLALVDRTPDFPSGEIRVHPDDLLAVIEVLTAPTPVGCGCLVIDDEAGETHVISNPCLVHGAERPTDFYGDGFWAGLRGGDGIDPDTLDELERVDWDAGYSRGLEVRPEDPTADVDDSILRRR